MGLCLVAHSCPTLCNPMDYSPPGSSGHGIFQTRILEWVAISSSRGSSWPRDQTSHLLCFLHCRWILYLLSHQGSPVTGLTGFSKNVSQERGMATHSSILAWKVDGQKSLMGCSPWGSHNWVHMCEGSGGRWVGSNKQVELETNKQTMYSKWNCCFGD